MYKNVEVRKQGCRKKCLSLSVLLIQHVSACISLFHHWPVGVNVAVCSYLAHASSINCVIALLMYVNVKLNEALSSSDAHTDTLRRKPMIHPGQF